MRRLGLHLTSATFSTRYQDTTIYKNFRWLYTQLLFVYTLWCGYQWDL